MNALEQQLDTLWEETRAPKSRKVEDLKLEVCGKADNDLEAVRHKTREVLVEHQQSLRQKLQDLDTLRGTFLSGVESWHRVSAAAVDDLRRDQQRLQAMVVEAAERMAKRKELLIEHQRKALDELTSQSLQILTDCQRKIDSCQ